MMGGASVRLRAISHSLPIALLLSHEAVMRHFRPALRAFDLTEQQWRVLRALSSIPESEIGDLADATCLVSPSLSRILKALNERGLIERRRSNKDKRLGLVAISRDGLVLVEELRPLVEGIYAEITSRYSGARVAELMNLLGQLTASLGDGARITISEALLSPLKESRRRRGEKAPAARQSSASLDVQTVSALSLSAVFE